eukprot:8184588-Pyramimonas_sp.AAC.1
MQVSATVHCIRKIVAASSCCLGLAILRILSRGACTSARFHRGIDRGCWRCDSDGATDSLEHYRVCPEVRRLSLVLAPCLAPVFSEESWCHCLTLVPPPP